MSASTNASDSPENTHFSMDELRACVEEGRRRKVPVMAHAHGAEGITMAANAGMLHDACLRNVEVFLCHLCALNTFSLRSLL
jgi:hypothetical protein